MKIKGPEVNGDFEVPMATFETPLWPSVNRGARLSMHCGGITAFITDERMTRSVTLQAPDALSAHTTIQALQQRQAQMPDIVAKSSRFAKLIDVFYQQVGPLIYIRFEFTTGDASGHNMVTLASEYLQRWILHEYPILRYVSLSGNMCTDKKVSAINAIRGRGKSVTAEIRISDKLCRRFLKVSPDAILELHVKKNLIGSTLAGSLRSANAHYANMLLAFYLATGQDAANIVEGSQGITHVEREGDDLLFSVNLPNIIVGTIGNGKNLDFVRENLSLLGCLSEDSPGKNARKLAIIAAASVLCGELSLMAALANEGELMESHISIERHPERN